MSTRTRITKLELELVVVQGSLAGVQKIVCTLASRAFLCDELKNLNDEYKKTQEATKHDEHCACRCGQVPHTIADHNREMTSGTCILGMLPNQGYEGTGNNLHAVRGEFNIDDLPTDPDEWEPLLQEAIDRAAKAGALSKCSARPNGADDSAKTMTRHRRSYERDEGLPRDSLL